MSRLRSIFVLWLLLALLLPLTAIARPLEVFVTIPPQVQFIERIGGAQVTVESLVQPGFDPHAFEPTPGQIARLSGADLYFGIGLPLESAWMERIRSANPDIAFVDLSAGIHHRRSEADSAQTQEAPPKAPSMPHGGASHENAPDHHHGASELDPHVWTSPLIVKSMGREIAEALIALAPRHEDLFNANLASFESALSDLDQEIRHTLAGLQQRRFMTLHPAWGYFADAYGLEQIAIEKEGKEPGPRSLAALIDLARQEHIRVIFTQPQLSPKAATRIATAIGGRVEVLDSLASDYFANMRRVAQAIAASEQNESH